MSHYKEIPAEPGSYLLVFYLQKKVFLKVGALGTFSFRKGWYFYSGSAFGPGGLKARLKHHLNPLKRFHWHIDYLNNTASLRGIWWQSSANFEHRWSAELAEAGFGSPVVGFGSSDCRCVSHLLYFPSRPKQKDIQTILSVSQKPQYKSV